MNSTEKNPGSEMWRRLNGLVTESEAKQKPCFICHQKEHSVETQAHVDGWCVLGEPNHIIIDENLNRTIRP